MNFARIGLSLACVPGLVATAFAADLPPPAAPVATVVANPYSADQFEIRGGGLISTWKPETGDAYANVELVLPKPFSVSGWQALLLPRPHLGAMGNLAGGTSYAYAGALWTANYERTFAEVFFGGAVHNGPLHSVAPDQPSLGCRLLYHTGANLGYRFDQHWTMMVTFDHISNGEPTLSSCRSNTGLSELGVRVGYSF
jgi:lipid A 3-O-deacylase